jgi:hypothetical protein
MRGDEFHEREGAFYLMSPIYVIDGLQRITAALRNVADGDEPHLGAMVHFETTEAWERDRFEDLNLGQTGLSNNVILANMSATNRAARIVRSIADTDQAFVLKGCITWTQNMRRGDLITAITFYKVSGQLHAHMATGMIGSVRDIPRAFDKLIDNIGERTFRANVRTFFDILNMCFSIRAVAFRNEAVALKSTFMLALARLFSRHEDFWEGNKLVVPKHVLDRLNQFPVADPTVRSLAGSSGNAVAMLEGLMVEHINRGRRTRLLRSRVVDLFEIEENEEPGDAE